jgi:hypothetical protein
VPPGALHPLRVIRGVVAACATTGIGWASRRRSGAVCLRPSLRREPARLLRLVGHAARGRGGEKRSSRATASMSWGDARDATASTERRSRRSS